MLQLFGTGDKEMAAKPVKASGSGGLPGRWSALEDSESGSPEELPLVKAVVVEAPADDVTSTEGYLKYLQETNPSAARELIQFLVETGFWLGRPKAMESMKKRAAAV